MFGLESLPAPTLRFIEGNAHVVPDFHESAVADRSFQVAIGTYDLDVSFALNRGFQLDARARGAICLPGWQSTLGALRDHGHAPSPGRRTCGVAQNVSLSFLPSSKTGLVLSS